MDELIMQRLNEIKDIVLDIRSELRRDDRRSYEYYIPDRTIDSEWDELFNGIDITDSPLPDIK